MPPHRKRRARGDLRAAFAELSPETIDAIAARVSELLDGSQLAHGPLVDAATVARRFGLTRAWVYEHARELGAIEIGAGPRPRLLFDLDATASKLRNAGEPAERTDPQPPPAQRKRRRQLPPADVPLLPIHSPRADRKARGLRAVMGGSSYGA